MVAEVAFTGQAASAVMTGAGDPAVNVKLADVAVSACELVEVTAKLYVVPCVSPVSVTEWEVTRELLSGDCDPYAVVVP